MEVCLHVATVGADERGAEAGEHQRLPALPDGRAAGGLVDVLSFLSGQIGFSLQGMTCFHALSVKRVGQLGAYGKTLTKIRFMISTKPALSEIGFGVCKNDCFSTRCMV